jgi:hypothetical protein
MRLEDALDELRGSVLRDASSIKSGSGDHYWTDEQLVRYINEAHSRFARFSLCLRDDTTPSVTRVVLASGVESYKLHPSIMMILSARHEDDQQDLVRTTHNRAANTANTNTDDWDFSAQVAPGKPTRFATDEGLDPSNNQAIEFRVIGVPDSTQTGKTVYLRVIRKVLTVLTVDDMEAQFETPEDYDLDVLEWAAWRALRNWDLDAQDRAKANDHKKRFEDAVVECRKEALQRFWQPVKWAFGGAGFGPYVK